MIAGVIIAIQSWFLQVLFSINLGLVNSAPVRIGFPIVLALANLFFVGALIVIAIATIIRKAEYGAKKVLWKLVVMAILVNFGLVICGAILSVSDEMAKFFIESVSPSTSGPGGETNFMGFAKAIAGAFNPGGAMISPDDLVRNPALSKESLGFVAKSANTIGNIVKPIVGILAGLGAFVIIITTLATLALMMLWRYVRLGMALILLPLAWAAWIFPVYHEHYAKWWKKFTQWAFFPPIVVFFIWLSLKISEVMAQQDGEYAPLYEGMTPDGGLTGIGVFFGNLISPIIAQTLKVFIIWGIMMAGIFAANELGIKFADGGIKAIERSGSWAKGKAMNYAKRAGRATYQGAGGRKLGQKLTQNTWGQGIKNRFGKGVVTTLGSGAAMLGRGLGDVAQKGGSDVVDSYKDSIPKDTAGKIARLKSNNNMPEILAMLSSMSAEDLSKVDTIGGMSLAEWLKNYHGKIGDYGQHELEKSLRDMGASHGLVDAALGHGDLGAAVREAMGKGDPRTLSKLMKNGGGLGLTPAQAAELQKAMLGGIRANFSPQQLADFAAKLDREQLENFKSAIESSINSGASADTILGSENADMFRKNGGFRSRGLRSELWNEAGRVEGGTSDDITSGTPAAHAPTPPRAANPPAAPSHGTGGNTPPPN